MKKFYFLIVFAMINATVFGLNFTIENQNLKISQKNDFTQFDGMKISGKAGEPAIPIKTFFFEIPQNKKIKSIKIIPQNFKIKHLNNELLPNPVQQPLIVKSIPKIKKNRKFYDKEFPENFLYNYGVGNCGNTKIGYVSYYVAKYFKKKLSIPNKFILKINLQNDKNIPINKQNYASNKILNFLNLSTKTVPDTSGYLLIYPQKFSEAYRPLISWRKLQGLKVYTETVEDIAENYSGNDLQEKIRNCIIDEYYQNDISFVTLGADNDDIPVRYFFAFDCHYGAYPDENNLPADMYYSCLDDNWDANGNGIYGEDDDEPDYFPEVFVSRITAKNQDELSHYISRLISYEKGLYDNYETAAGFSMDLWHNSHSILCQQYIYNHYFPDNFDIDILSGDDATNENAIELLDSNKNIVQHTGHANWMILSLENDYFMSPQCNQISNDFSGLFYSIGCWSSALDYDAISKHMLINKHAGFNGYVGNSRYGWGSPSSPGFGFSEFYQKEFFKNLFKKNINILAESNAMQKVAFIPYMSGVSVYKWCAYELNAIGDSYARIFTENPKNMNYTLENAYHKLLIKIKDEEGLPVSGVVVNLNNQNYYSNNVGIVEIESPSSGVVSFYKYGFKYVSFDYSGDEIGHNFFVAVDSLIDKNEYYQSENIKLNVHLSNKTADNYDCVLQYSYDNKYISYDESPKNFHLNPHSYFSFKDNLLRIKSVAESGQINPNTYLPIELILKTLDGEILDTITIPISVKSPEIKIVGTDIDSVSGKYYFSFRVQNTGNADISDFTLNLNSETLSFIKQDFSFQNIFHSSDILDFETEIKPIAEDSAQIKLINCQSEMTVKSNRYSFLNIIPVSTNPTKFFDDFESGNKWSYCENWEKVSNFSVSGDSSLSCRVDSSQTGIFEIHSPTLNYLPDSRISFEYRYKVYMYGHDSIIFQIEHSGIVDTLICLGSGGALNNPQEHGSNNYIYSDWANYDFDINEVVNHPLSVGEQFRINLKFTKGSNADYIDPDNGIFIDDFKYYQKLFSENSFDNYGFKLYPNPAINSINIKFLQKNNTQSSITIFNIKGQKVGKINFEPNNNKFGRSCWKLNDLASGVYLFKLVNGKNVHYKKAIIFRK